MRQLTGLSCFFSSYPLQLNTRETLGLGRDGRQPLFSYMQTAQVSFKVVLAKTFYRSDLGFHFNPLMHGRCHSL